jgi:GNAT superfamily N-acetyltransferase
MTSDPNRVLQSRRFGGPAYIDVRDQVPADQAEALWSLYNDAFMELRATAVQRHVMIREEFDQVMADRRVDKYVAVRTATGGTGQVGALATLTNELEAMPLISPDYFRHRWPQLFEENRIWYIGFVAVHPRHRGTGLFDQVVGELYRTVLGKGPNAVAALDVCGRNEEYHLPQAIHRILANMRLSRVRSDRMDAQAYWCYEFG